MTGPGIGEWAVHTLRCHDAPCAEAELREAARGKEDRPEVWGPDHWRDAVVIFPRTEALPAMLAAASGCEERTPWRFT
eukprot:3500720-Lingulodinium_polyedra.AAC.1